MIETPSDEPKIYYTGRQLLAMPAQQIYPLFKLREDVFIEEQDCAVAEIDDIDPLPGTHHVLAYVHPSSGPEYPYGQPDPGSPLRIVGTARVYGPPDQQHIDRVCVAKDMRTHGIGSALMREALDVAQQRAAGIDPTTGTPQVRVDAQTYLKKFYEGFGFEQDGEEFILNLRKHIPMVKTF